MFLERSRLIDSRSIPSVDSEDRVGVSIHVNGKKKVVFYDVSNTQPPESLNARISTEALLHVIENFSPVFRVEDGRIKWEQRDLDFKKLLALQEIINQDLSDADWRAQLPQIEKILLDTWIFQKLNSEDIKVSKAHIGNTPFRHTINVMEQLITNGLPVEVVRAVRLSAVWHDVGKLFGADLPTAKYHAFLSSMLSWDFFYEYTDLSPELIQRVLFAIQFHHTSEGFDFKWLAETEEGNLTEAKNRLGHLEAAVVLYALAAADISSIQAYAHFVGNLNNMLRIFQPELHEGLKALDLFRPVLRNPHSNGYKANGHQTQNAEALVQPQHG